MRKTPRSHTSRAAGVAGLGFLLLAMHASPVSAQQTGPIDASDSHFVSASVSPATDSVPADTSLMGPRSWLFQMFNHSGENPQDVATTFNHPTMIINSDLGPITGYLFPQNTGATITFPFVLSADTLPPFPNGSLRQDFQNTSVIATFTPGFDSSRTMDPLVIPHGGAEQTVTIRVRGVDSSRYGTVPGIVSGFAFGIGLGGNVQSATPPDNLDQGETIFQSVPSADGVFWGLNGPILGKEYAFTAVLWVPNPDSSPIISKPSLNLGATNYHVPTDVRAQSVTIPDPLLGSSGGVVFSVDETVDWHPRDSDETFALAYPPLVEDAHNIPVAIDIKPGSFPNSVNPKNRGTIPVAILSDASFYAPASVDKTSLTFGPTGDERSLALCNDSPQDVNADGLLDQVCHFNTLRTRFQPGDTVGVLKGKTVTGVQLTGSDSVRIVP